MTASTNKRIRLRPIALPAEHGGWSFLLEPILLGWLVAFSMAGLFYGIGMFFAFMARHPLKLALTDRRRDQRLARTPYAERFALGYSAISVIAFALALFTGGVTPFIPLLIALPLFALQAYWDAHNRSRELYAELSAPLALAVIAICITRAGGLTPAHAIAYWSLIVVRPLPSILYVRARLRLERGKPIPYARIYLGILNLAVLLVVVLLVGLRLAPFLSLYAFCLFYLRILVGLQWRVNPTSPKVIGVQEVFFGVMFVLLTALGHTGLGQPYNLR